MWKNIEFGKSLLGTYYALNAMLYSMGSYKRVLALQILLVYLSILKGCMKR